MTDSAKHIPTLRRLRDRLSDLSMRNRSLRLIRLPKKRAFDLAWLDAVHPGDSARVMERLLSGRNQAAMLLTVGSDDEDALVIHRGLTYLNREVRLVEEERGVYDLSAGLMFLCGCVSEGKYIQAPMFLLPRRLTLDRKRRGGTRWVIEPMGDAKEVHVNRTLLLALQKYADLTLDLESLEQSMVDLLFGTRRRDGWLTELSKSTADLLRKHGLKTVPTLQPWGDTQTTSEAPDSELVPALPLYKAADVPTPPLRRFELRPHAVISRFPLADTALLSDYDDLVRVLEVHPTQPLGYAGALLGDALPPRASSKRQMRLGEQSGRWHIESTDESQEAVLEGVLQGQSMAVYGPPGTGKSQLIANLVASILARGERVLVVSQKRPALDVVAQRLGPDLNRFVALVHDPVRDRQLLCDRIIASLDKNLELPGTFNQAERNHLLKVIEQQEAFFDKVNASLNVRSDLGYTYFEAHLHRLRHPVAPIALKVVKLPRVSPSTLRDAVPQLQQYVVDTDWARTPGTWKERRPSYGARSLDDLERFQDEQLPKLTAAMSDYSKWDLARPSDVNELESSAADADAHEAVRLWCQRAGSLSQSNWQWLPVVHSHDDPHRAILSDVKTLETLLTHRERTEGRVLLAGMEVGEVEAIFQEYETTAALWYKFLLPSWYQVQDRVRSVLTKEEIGEAELARGVEIWRRRATYTAELRSTPAKLSLLARANLDLSTFTKGMVESLQKTNQAAAEASQAWKSDVQAKARHLVASIPADAEQASQAQRRAEYALRAPQLLQSLQRREKALGEWLGDAAGTWMRQAHKQRQPSFIGARFQDEVASDFEALGLADRRMAETEERYPDLVRLTLEARSAGVSDIEQELWSAFSDRWLRDALNSRPILKDVDQGSLERRRDRVSGAWGRLPQANRTVLISKLHDTAATIKDGHRRNLLKRAQQKRFKWSVRKLVEQFWTKGLSDLLPVWLCSPETVAAVFPLSANFFDYVVFDEASQCTLPQGLTAVYRGRTCIVAGDEQQLPPSNLFSTTLEDEDELDEVIDEESLLSRATSAGSAMSLTWHYRSRYPELIQFSNEAFYNGGLRVAPLPVPSFSPPALEWVQVPGAWTRRANEAEGRLAVEIIERYLRDHPELTIGVITVNRQQSDHIQDLLDERLQSSPTLQKRYEEAMERELDERPFIRNLENVQGDERDVIILSVAYSADASGRVPLRFGSLSMPGGERRLNVAISRARRKMIVLCSFDPESQLQVSEQSSQGAQILQGFLRYARSVGAGRTASAPAQALRAPAIPAHAEATDHIASVLAEWGYQVERAVGGSAARVDIAVRSKESPDRYVLGILLDGPGASWASTAIGREVGRIEYLTRYLWPIQVVSIPALVRSRQAVLDALRERLAAEEQRLDAVLPPPSVKLPRQATPQPAVVEQVAATPVQSSPVPSRRTTTKPVKPKVVPSAPESAPEDPHELVVEGGSTVKYRNLNRDSTREIVLVGPTVPRGVNATSLNSPIAQVLMGAKVGQVVPLELQNDTHEIEVLAIKPPPRMPG